MKHLIWMRLGNNRIGIESLRLYLKWTKRDAAVVESNFDLVVEGYPRCANTYFVAAFRLAQQRRMKIAHHVHGNQQIFMALRLGIPTVVLIRDPVDAVTSLLVRDPTVGAASALRNYVSFYQPLLPISNRFIIADFDRTVRDIDSVIQEINSRYDANFRTVNEAGTRDTDIMSAIDQMDLKESRAERPNILRTGRPSSARNEQLGAIRKKLHEDISRASAILRRAESLYASFISSPSIEATGS